MTLDQLRSQLSASEIKHLCRSGVIERVQPQIYRFVGARDTLQCRAQAAALAAPGAVVSHSTASVMWGVELQNESHDRIELTVCDSKRPRLIGVQVHQSSDTIRRRSVCAIPVTIPERTIIDVACRLNRWQLSNVIQSFLQLNLITLSTLRLEMERIAGSGRNGIGPVREFLEQVDPRSPDIASAFARKVRRRLVEAGLPAPETEYAVRPPGGPTRYLDFAYPDLLIGIEADGRKWHTRLNDFENDLERHGSIEELGWTLIHVTHRRVDEGVARVLRTFYRRSESLSDLERRQNREAQEISRGADGTLSVFQDGTTTAFRHGRDSISNRTS